jgi:Asp-tRNA(Asn)/Glu-tRNA(Gln) amidotransferase A subunit family amidase
VYGLKPSFGRVSERGAAPIAWSVGHLGPIGATALDAAIGYAVMSGRDEHDIPSMRQPDITLDGVMQDDLNGVRLGIYRPWFDDCDDGVKKANHTLLDALKARGAKIVDVEVPNLHLLQLAHIVTIVSEMRASQLLHMNEHGTRYALNTRMILALTNSISSSDYVHAQRIRGMFHQRFNKMFESIDVLVTPTSACTAPPLRDDSLTHGESDIMLVDKVMRYVRPANFLGLPSISVPAGYDHAGLPVGFMATGRAWEEALLLRIARVAEGCIERRAPKAHWRLLAS